ncbi:MAG: cytochrome c [Verrucomicrobia bacterium]|nr:MAG: cytochrome c [Verrucomicrobiota bacterium]
MLSKRQARVFFLGGTFLFSGIFLVLSIDTMRRVPKQTNAEGLTPEVVAGKRIWERNNCMGCHTIFGEGAYYAPELTKVVERRGVPWLKVFLRDPQAMFPGQRKMVQYDFTDEQIDHVIAFLDWCGQVDLNGFPADPPLRASLRAVSGSASSSISAAVADRPLPDVFTTGSCLGCHEVLGQGGAAGAAIGAPVLDDVYTRKTRDELIEWIGNPQGVKPGTAMPNLVGVAISEEQVIEIVDFLLSLNPATTEPGNQI